MRIEVENLTFVYSEKSKSLQYKALDDISLTIEEGDFFGIVGETGSGKSTFVQHINGLIKTQKNCKKFTVGEFDLTDKKCDYKSLRSKVGMVFQYPEYQLFAETVFEDVEFGLKNFFPNLTQEERSEKVKQAIETVGLDFERVKNKSPFEMSGGQKRRVAIAGVIVTRPEVLVLDEPVAGLDPKGKLEFIKLLKRLHNDFVKTIIIVSHDMDLVAENCNKIAVLKKGKIVETGSPKEIFCQKNIVENSGLDLPLTAYLQRELEQNGIKLNSDLTVDNFVEEVKNYYCKIKGGK
ncbi:MAG: energy-coupling factor transporter ATPase [Clostridia bacterium]|nr:energy-coupling factor transporter ATPase [Clostridia bacterium]